MQAATQKISVAANQDFSYKISPWVWNCLCVQIRKKAQGNNPIKPRSTHTVPEGIIDHELTVAEKNLTHKHMSPH